MPRKKREGNYVPLFAEIPAEVKAKLDAMAARRRISLALFLTLHFEEFTADEPAPAKAKRPKK